MSDPATETAAEVLDFALKDGRAYVRATDVLAAVLARWPDTALTLRFLRPLDGPAVLIHPPRPGAGITGRAGDVAFSLSRKTGHAPQEAREDPVKVLHLGGKAVHLFVFAPVTPLAARIGAIFERVHPRQADRFLVRQIVLYPGQCRSARTLWFRLRTDPRHARAALTLHSRFGVLAEIDFRLVPRG